MSTPNPFQTSNGSPVSLAEKAKADLMLLENRSVEESYRVISALSEILIERIIGIQEKYNRLDLIRNGNNVVRLLTDANDAMNACCIFNVRCFHYTGSDRGAITRLQSYKKDLSKKIERLGSSVGDAQEITEIILDCSRGGIETQPLAERATALHEQYTNRFMHAQGLFNVENQINTCERALNNRDQGDPRSCNSALQDINVTLDVIRDARNADASISSLSSSLIERLNNSRRSLIAAGSRYMRLAETDQQQIFEQHSNEPEEATFYIPRTSEAKELVKILEHMQQYLETHNSFSEKEEIQRQLSRLGTFPNLLDAFSEDTDIREGFCLQLMFCSLAHISLFQKYRMELFNAIGQDSEERDSSASKWNNKLTELSDSESKFTTLIRFMKKHVMTLLNDTENRAAIETRVSREYLHQLDSNIAALVQMCQEGDNLYKETTGREVIYGEDEELLPARYKVRVNT